MEKVEAMIPKDTEVTEEATDYTEKKRIRIFFREVSGFIHLPGLKPDLRGDLSPRKDTKPLRSCLRTFLARRRRASYESAGLKPRVNSGYRDNEVELWSRSNSPRGDKSPRQDTKPLRSCLRTFLARRRRASYKSAGLQPRVNSVLRISS
jgi:hypothetical protein